MRRESITLVSITKMKLQKKKRKKMSVQLLIIPQKKEKGQGREVGMKRDGGGGVESMKRMNESGVEIKGGRAAHTPGCDHGRHSPGVRVCVCVRNELRH